MKQNLANDQQFNQKIADYYQRAIDQINRTIDENANLIVDEKGNHTGYQPVTADQMATYQREAKHVVQQANQMRAGGKTPTYGNWSDAVNNRMRAYNATMRINRLELIKSQIGVHLTEATTETDKALTAKLSDDYIKECKRQAGIMEVTAQPSMWTTPKVAKIVMAQTNSATFSDRLWANQDALKARLDAVISNGVIQGQNPRKMATQLKKQVKTTVTNQRYVTERIARTESARVQFSAQMDSIKANGYEYVQWFAEIKACAECKEIASKDNGWGPGIYEIDKVPKIPDDTHPNCRCSISETWVDEAQIKKKDPSDTEKGYGLRVGDNSVDMNYIHSKAYRAKFDHISDNKRLNKQLYKQAVAMLTHRQNTDGEDSYIFSSDGKIINRAFGKEGKLEVSVPTKVLSQLKKQYGRGNMVGIHNHPTNVPPTGSDFASAGYRGYDFGVVVTHDGRVYKYSAGNTPFDKEIIDKYIAQYRNPPYNLDEDKAEIKTISTLRRFGLQCEKL